MEDLMEVVSDLNEEQVGDIVVAIGNWKNRGCGLGMFGFISEGDILGYAKLGVEVYKEGYEEAFKNSLIKGGAAGVIAGLIGIGGYTLYKKVKKCKESKNLKKGEEC